jgi:hypothetical protein
MVFGCEELPQCSNSSGSMVIVELKHLPPLQRHQAQEFNMPTRKLLALLGLTLAAAITQAGETQASTEAKVANYRPQDYKVFVDKPTGFAYIKTPYGWKFIRHLEPEQVAKLRKDVTTPPKPTTAVRNITRT